MSKQTTVEVTELNRNYYYRPCQHDNGATLKCAGFGAEKPEHRAFYEPYFKDPANVGSGSGAHLLPGVSILKGYHGDKITREYAAENSI